MEEINSDRFKEVIKSKAIVQFSATWCGPCKTLTKTIAGAEKHIDTPFFKLDIDSARDVSSKYNVRSVPTLILFEDGKEKKRKIGNCTLLQIQEFAT